ncbi:hypothetical protein ACPZ19_06445 [Amycolatopsis lurida]
MYRKVETLGARLLGALVPRVDAAAACSVTCWTYCWQCNYRPCCRKTNCLLQCH